MQAVLCRPARHEGDAQAPLLAKRGGLWLESGEVRIHLGVEADFRPARKAHPAIAVADLDALARLLSGAGHDPAWDDAIP
ncbi:hypothetical protein ACFSM9_05265, partial [Microvirga arabica]